MLHTPVHKRCHRGAKAGRGHPITGHAALEAGGIVPDSAKSRSTVGAERVSDLRLQGFAPGPPRATPNALRIAYQDDAGDWASLQVDFIVVTRRDDGSLAASIVDPHGDFIADARAKLRALADFAETHGDSFIRIVSVSEGSDNSLRYLDLLEPHVRQAVRDFDGAHVTALFDSHEAVPYL